MHTSGAPNLAWQLGLGGHTIPDVVVEVAAGREVELAWRNELGGLTFRFAGQFIKWNPLSTGVDLNEERQRLDWLATRHPAPEVVAFNEDESAQWMITVALPGDSVVTDAWRTRPSQAISAIAEGLRVIHAVPIDGFPQEWNSQGWFGRRLESLGVAPAIDAPVLVHGDACAPNTLIGGSGQWVGHVDLGDLGVGDRWADLAIASMSLDWNFGDGHQAEFFGAYGVEPDEERIRYYRDLWQIPRKNTANTATGTVTRTPS